MSIRIHTSSYSCVTIDPLIFHGTKYSRLLLGLALHCKFAYLIFTAHCLYVENPLRLGIPLACLTVKKFRRDIFTIDHRTRPWILKLAANLYSVLHIYCILRAAVLQYYFSYKNFPFLNFRGPRPTICMNIVKIKLQRKLVDLWYLFFARYLSK